MLRSFFILLKRDLLLAMRRRTDIFTTLFFFLIVVSLFPLSAGVEKSTLLQIAPSVSWVAALLASMLALERLFASDYEDGTLEQFILMPQPLSLLVLAKVTAHWLLTGLPLVLVAPLVGLQYGLSSTSIGILMLALLLGTPILSLLGAIGAALTLGVRGGGVLISLLILPLYIPVLVYGSGAVVASMLTAGEAEPYLMLLSAFMILALLFSPLVTAAALKISLE